MEQIQEANPNRKFYIIVGILAVILVVLAIILAIYTTNKNKSGKQAELTPTPPLLPTVIIGRQAESDASVSNKMVEVFDKYPWINSLPLQSKEYFVYLDTSDGLFHGTIYATPENRKSVEDIVKKELQNIGVNTDQYKYKFEYQSPQK